MKLKVITKGLKKLLLKNHYSSATIQFYEREWSKIHSFLIDEYGDSEYEMERGLKYLEKQYNFISKYEDGTLSQQRVQLLRVVHMLEDYRLHQVLTRRYYASKNPIILTDDYLLLFTEYEKVLEASGLSRSTIDHYRTISKEFLDYLTQLEATSELFITMNTINSYLKTLAGYSFKTVEQKICGLRHLLRFMYSTHKIKFDFAQEIHMPSISKSAKIPSTWQIDELKLLLAAVDRSSPIGKRDYAMMVLACVLGLRIGDIKNLKFSNFNWEEKSYQSFSTRPKTAYFTNPGCYWLGRN